jgi:hypothetical protein
VTAIYIDARVPGIPADVLLDQRRADYVRRLQGFDWHYEAADDHRAWKAGFDAYRALIAEGLAIDPSHALWNEHAPAAHRRGQ